MQLGPPPIPPLSRNKNWFERNLLWLIPSIILLGVLSLGSFVFLILGFMKNSDAYQGALTRIQNSPAAIEALGAPITDRFFFTGQININGSDGNANLAIRVKGSRARATAYVIADRSLGRWHYTQLILSLNDSDTRINLSDPARVESEDSPVR